MMFLTMRQRLNHLITAYRKVQDGSLTFEPDASKFGFPRFEVLFNPPPDEIKGFPCVVYNRVSDPVKYGVKVNPLENKYDFEDHPCRQEVKLLKEFSKLVVQGVTPHITFYFKDFDCKNNQKALTKFPLKFLRRELHTHSNVLISEFVPGGSIEEWVQEVRPDEEQWRYIIFAMAWTLLVLQDKYKFMHNDFHYGNVLVDNSICPDDPCLMTYNLKTKDGKVSSFFIPNCGIIPKIWDFEFGNAYKGITLPPNRFGAKDENIPSEFNPYYDIHFLLTSLLELYLPETIERFIRSIYPPDFIPECHDGSTTSYDDSSDSNSTATTSSTMSEDDDYDSIFYHTDEEMSDGSSDTTSTTTATSSTSSQTGSESSCESEYRTEYLLGDRMLNDAHLKVNSLPTPYTVLTHPFFKKYTEPPKTVKKFKDVVTFAYEMSGAPLK